MLPNIIAITETKLKIKAPEIKLEGYVFEDCRTTTQTVGAGIYISEGTNYNVRDDISIELDRCEEKWIEINSIHTAISERATSAIIEIVYQHQAVHTKRFAINCVRK